MIHTARVNVVPCDLRSRVDTEGESALAGARARSRSVKRGDSAVAIAKKAVSHIAPVNVVSRDCLRRADGEEESALAGASARARSVECGDGAVSNAQEAVRHGACVKIPRSVRDALLAEGLAEEHRWVPNSGWITFHVRSEEDFRHAVWLMRLSYLRYAMKTATDSREMLDQQSQELHLSPQFKSLLERLLPAKAAVVSTQLLTT